MLSIMEKCYKNTKKHNGDLSGCLGSEGKIFISLYHNNSCGTHIKSWSQRPEEGLFWFPILIFRQLQRLHAEGDLRAARICGEHHERESQFWRQHRYLIISTCLNCHWATLTFTLRMFSIMFSADFRKRNLPWTLCVQGCVLFDSRVY